MQTRRIALAATAGLALVLAACSGSKPEAPVNAEDNAAFDEVVNEELPLVNEAPLPEPTVEVTPTPAPAVPDDRTSEAQMYDDAAAVGMTARVDRGGGDQNSSTPAPVDVKQ